MAIGAVKFNQRWHADGGTVRDENGQTVAHFVGQAEDNRDAVIGAAAPELWDRLVELLDMLDSGDALNTSEAHQLVDRIQAELR